MAKKRQYILSTDAFWGPDSNYLAADGFWKTSKSDALKMNLKIATSVSKALNNVCDKNVQVVEVGQ